MPDVSVPKWRTLDLNLLVVFHAVMQERSATAAGVRLNMSQPAVSHALTRLRQSLGDDLLVRTPDGLDPTPFALRIEAGVAEALDQLRTTIEGAKDFVPKTAEREFTIALNNYSALVLAAPIAEAVARAAPGIRLNLRPSGNLVVTENLDRGSIDLVISQIPAPAERFSDVRLFDEGFSALVREAHPAVADGDISIQALGELRHLVLSSTGENTQFVDVALKKAGQSRRVAMQAPLLAAGRILIESDLVAVVGTRAARALAAVSPLRVARLPFETPSFPIAMLWHRRFDDFEAHKWLRGLITKVGRELRH
jgi:DNA-binding transcriptional LysR family regulator